MRRCSQIRQRKRSVSILLPPGVRPRVPPHVPHHRHPPALQAAIYAIFLSYSTVASQALYTKSYLIVIVGILYPIGFTIAILWVASRFFASEKVFIAKLRFGRARKKVEAA